MRKSSGWFSVGPGVSVFLRHKTWWADIRTGERRYKRNLRTHDYKEAAARALDLAKGPAPNPVVAWSSAVETYLTDYSPLYHAAATKAKAQSVLSEFGAFLVEKSNTERVSLASANRDRVEEWMRRCSERVTAATVNSKLRTLRAFLRWGVGKKWLPEDPTQGIRRLKEAKRDDKELSLEEIKRILEKADQLQECVVGDLFKLGLNTGARPGEMVNLYSEDVDLDGRVLFLRNRASHALKDREDRRIKLNDLALEVLRRKKFAAGRDSGTLLFPSSTGTVLNLSNLSHRFKKVAEAAGVPRATLYMARHTFASYAAAYLPQFVLQDIMGHSDPGLTARHYIHAAASKAPAPPVLGV